MAFLKKKKKTEEDPELWDEDLEDEKVEEEVEEEIEEEAEEPEEEEEDSGNERLRKFVLILAAVLLVVLVAVIVVSVLSSAKNRAKPDTGVAEVAKDAPFSETEVVPEPADAPGLQGAEPKPAEKPELQSSEGGNTSAAAKPSASEPASESAAAQTAEASPEPTGMSSSSSAKWDIDEDLVVYECILDLETMTKYTISFAECDEAGNPVKVYSFDDVISPSRLGKEFHDNEPLPYWFYLTAPVHVKATADLSQCEVTKPAG